MLPRPREPAKVHGLSRAFSKQEAAVSRHVAEAVDSSGWPADLDRVDPLEASQSEVDP